MVDMLIGKITGSITKELHATITNERYNSVTTELL